MSSRAKGNRNELKAVKELEAEGWLVYRVKGTTIWNKECDIFGIFDLIARKEKKIRWIQVKSNKLPSQAPFKEFFGRYCSINESVEIWVWKDYQGWNKLVMVE